MWIVVSFILTIVSVNGILNIPLPLLIISWAFCILMFIAKIIGGFCGGLLKEEIAIAIREDKAKMETLNQEMKEQQIYIEELERKLMLNDIPFKKKNFDWTEV